jgi:hypothetical protein
MSKMEIIEEVATKAFESEATRTATLQGKAEKIMAGVAAVVGYQLLHVEDLAKSSHGLVFIPCWLAIVLLALSFAGAFLVSAEVRNYYYYPRGRALWDDLSGDTMSDEEARKRIAIMLLDAREENAQINDRRATRIDHSGSMLVGGFVLAVASRLASALLP